MVVLDRSPRGRPRRSGPRPGALVWRSTGRERAGLLAAPSSPSATLQITGTDPIDDAPEASRFAAVVSGSAEAELPRGSSWDLIARNERLAEHLPRVLEAHIAYRAMKGLGLRHPCSRRLGVARRVPLRRSGRRERRRSALTRHRSSHAPRAAATGRDHSARWAPHPVRWRACLPGAQTTPASYPSTWRSSADSGSQA